MIKRTQTYCDRCGAKITDKPSVELVARIDSEIEKTGVDCIDICKACWPGAKKFFNLK